MYIVHVNTKQMQKLRVWKNLIQIHLHYQSYVLEHLHCLSHWNLSQCKTNTLLSTTDIVGLTLLRRFPQRCCTCGLLHILSSSYQTTSMGFKSGNGAGLFHQVNPRPSFSLMFSVILPYEEPLYSLTYIRESCTQWYNIFASIKTIDEKKKSFSIHMSFIGPQFDQERFTILLKTHTKLLPRCCNTLWPV